MKEDLQKKIQQSIKLLKSVAPQDGSPVEVAYSGGKDSDVILQLVKESGINYRAIYKNTTIDPPGTIKHVKDMGAEIVQPRRTFFEQVAYAGFPTRFNRHCCKELKEYKILDKAVMGVRKAESTKRNAMYKEPTACRYYGSKKNHVEAIYPILDWTNEDVKSFIEDRGIVCAPWYYRGGQFDVNQRLGCLCCPLKSQKKRIKEFKEFPRFVKLYIRAGQKWIDTHPDSESLKYYKDAYEKMYFDLFEGSMNKHIEGKTTLFGDTDYKALLEDIFGIDLTI